MSISSSGTTTLTVTGTGAGTPPVEVLNNTASSAIGNTTVGADKIAVVADTKKTIQVTFAGGSISGIRIWGDGLGGGTGTATVKAVVYANSAGDWGARYQYGTEVNVVAGQPGGFIFLPFSGSVTPTGIYHIGFHVGGASPILRIAQITTGVAHRTQVDTYSDGAADPGGVSDTGDRSFTAYALVSGPGGGPGGGVLTFNETLAPGSYWYDVYTERVVDGISTRLSANRYPLVIEVPQVGGGGVNGYHFRVSKGTPDILRLYKSTTSSYTQLKYDERTMAAGNKIGIRKSGTTINYYWHNGTTWAQLDTSATDATFTNGVISIQANSNAIILDNLIVRQATGGFGTGTVIWQENFTYPNGPLKDNITWLDSFDDGQISLRVTSNQVTQNDDTFYQDNYTIQTYGDGDYEIQLVALPGVGEHLWFSICGVPATLQIAGRYFINNTFDTETIDATPINWTNVSSTNLVDTGFSIRETANDRYLSLRGSAAVASVLGYTSSAYNIGLDYSKNVSRAVKFVFESSGPGSSRIYLFKQVKIGDLVDNERFVRLRHEGTTMYIERMQLFPGPPEILDTITSIPAGKITVWIEINSTQWRVKINGVNYDTALGDGVLASHALQYTKGNIHLEVANSSVTPHEFKMYEIKAMASVPTAPKNLSATLEGSQIVYSSEPNNDEDQVNMFGFQLVKDAIDYGSPIENAVVPVRGPKPIAGTYVVEAYVENESPW